MATHSNNLAWRIPWTEEPYGLQTMGSDMTEWLTLWLQGCDRCLKEVGRSWKREWMNEWMTILKDAGGGSSFGAPGINTLASLLQIKITFSKWSLGYVFQAFHLPKCTEVTELADSGSLLPYFKQKTCHKFPSHHGPRLSQFPAIDN